jgi:hypothetical protein
MTAKEEQKYSYRYTFEARKPGETNAPELPKSELQSYINEVLGIRKAKDQKDEWGSI